MAGTSYSFAELRALYLAEGGPAQWADTMAAIALAESSGCRYALAGPRDIRPVKTCTYRQTNGENSVGLWQINVRAHPQYDEFSLFDPHSNARAAVAVLGRGTPTPWSTYLNGAYRANLPGAGAPPGSHGSPKAPRTSPSPRHQSPRTQLPSSPTPPGSLMTRRGTVVANWHNLMLALGSTLPAQDYEARKMIRRFTRAVR